MAKTPKKTKRPPKPPKSKLTVGQLISAITDFAKAREKVIEAVGQDTFFLAVAVKRHIKNKKCGREYDDDAPQCYNCENYAICDALVTFEWMFEGDGPYFFPHLQKYLSDE